MFDDVSISSWVQAYPYFVVVWGQFFWGVSRNKNMYLDTFFKDREDILANCIVPVVLIVFWINGNPRDRLIRIGSVVVNGVDGFVGIEQNNLILVGIKGSANIGRTPFRVILKNIALAISQICRRRLQDSIWIMSMLDKGLRNIVCITDFTGCVGIQKGIQTGLMNLQRSLTHTRIVGVEVRGGFGFVTDIALRLHFCLWGTVCWVSWEFNFFGDKKRKVTTTYLFMDVFKQ